MPQLYAHLLPAERLLWQRFLDRYGHLWQRYDYDIRVGQGRPIDPSWPPEIQDMARHLSQKRIDAVGYRDGSPTLFEVTPRGSRTTYGALLLYARLYPVTTGYTGPLPLVAVVGMIDPDLLRVMQADGITVYLLSPDVGA